MKAVFITGGTTGLGLEMAKIYLSRGDKVGVCGREREKFDENFDANRDNVSFYQVDVANRDQVKTAIADFSNVIGLDILIANAGMSHTNKTKIPDFPTCYKMVHVNLLGVMYAFEAAMDVMVPRQKGQLVAISSVAALNGLPGTSAYSATKSAVLKFCESLHVDLKQFNIAVTAICPGFVDTPLTRKNSHPMPFKMNSQKAARLMVKAIDKKKMIYGFPFFFYRVLRVLSVIPRTWYRAFMSIKAFNYSKD